MSNSILVVEDDPVTREWLAAALEEGGFRPVLAGGMNEALKYLVGQRPGLVILDLALPDGDGLELCSHIRAGAKLPYVPIIALTGRDKISDKKLGFGAGVDAYLTKPVVMEELLMWVKAVLRRVTMDRNGGAALKLGRLEIDPKSHLVKFGGRPVPHLTHREFLLLFGLAKASPKVLSRKEIISQVWLTVAVENLVDTHLFNLRKKLPPEAAARIQTIVGRGFRYYDPD